MKLIDELKRRNVFRVALFYVASAWVLLQIADLLFEVLLVPHWTLRFIFGLLLAAFPFVLFFAWAYELTPEGIKRDADVAPKERSSATGGKLDRAIILLLVVLLAAVGYGQWRTPEPVSPEPTERIAQDGTDDETADDAVPETDESPAETAIAVLPFANMSGAADNEYFSDGLSETLLHLLARIPELQVVARTSSFQFKGRNEDVRKIGMQLNVGHVLEGSVQRAGERVRITAQLIDTQNGYHIWSETFDRTLEDVFAVQDEIAASVVDA
ncbi:MAG: adenylyl cyclase, partial [Pseudomonadota bacterium]